MDDQEVTKNNGPLLFAASFLIVVKAAAAVTYLIYTGMMIIIHMGQSSTLHTSSHVKDDVGPPCRERELVMSFIHTCNCIIEMKMNTEHSNKRLPETQEEDDEGGCDAAPPPSPLLLCLLHSSQDVVMVITELRKCLLKKLGDTDVLMMHQKDL